METEQFSPVARRKISDEIFLMLQEKIFLGMLEPGKKLPSERELSKQLGVTRVPLREALKRLQTMNLIEVRHGDGIYVLDYQSNGSFEFLMSIIQSGLTLEKPLVKSLLEFRLIVVPELFRLAAKNATEENIKNLEEILSKEHENYTNRDRLMELDFEFHTEIARASGNLFAQLLYNSLKPVYLTLSAQFFNNITDLEQIPNQAEQVLAALKAKDGETLAKNTRYFLELVNEFMLSKLNE